MSLSNGQKQYWIGVIVAQLNTLADEAAAAKGWTKDKLREAARKNVIYAKGIGDAITELKRQKLKKKQAEEAINGLEAELYEAIKGVEGSKYRRSYWDTELYDLVTQEIDLLVSTLPELEEARKYKAQITKVSLKINLETSPSRLADWLRGVLPNIGIETDIEL